MKPPFPTISPTQEPFAPRPWTSEERFAAQWETVAAEELAAKREARNQETMQELYAKIEDY